MAENRWIISDISKKTHLEAHVLRYWEKELELQIPRNELGHRYYLDCHIDIFNKIHELKQAGYQLKAIKNAINGNAIYTNVNVSAGMAAPNMNNIIAMPAAASRAPANIMYPAQQEPAYKQPPETKNPSDKMEQFKQILRDVMLETMEIHGKDMGNQISDKVIKQMDYLMRMQDELEDERYRRLDETIRSYQKDKRHGASDKENKKNKSLFKKKQRDMVGHT